jgi:Secretion system C-terminal sorting domain
MRKVSGLSLFRKLKLRGTSYQIRLIDLNGKVVYQTSNQAADPTIIIENLPSGMYVVQILSKHNTVINAQKFVKMD